MGLVNAIKEYKEYQIAREICSNHLRKPKNRFSYFKGMEIINTEVHNARMKCAKYEFKRGKTTKITRDMFTPDYLRK